jgi:hypothetical protein
MYTSRIALLTLAALIAGCSRSATYVTPDGKVVVQQGSKPGQGQVTYSGKDGKVTIDASGTKLPDDYPKDVPVASNAKIVMASTVNNAQGQGSNLTLESTDSAENLIAFYKKGLADNGWTINTTATYGAVNMIGASKDKREAAIQVMEADGKRMVTQIVGTKN